MKPKELLARLALAGYDAHLERRYWWWPFAHRVVLTFNEQKTTLYLALQVLAEVGLMLELPRLASGRRVFRVDHTFELEVVNHFFEERMLLAFDHLAVKSGKKGYYLFWLRYLP